MSEVRTRSRWWYLLPIGLGIIGGLIAFLVLRKEDYDMARDCFIWGIVINTVVLVAYAIVSVSR
jgi:cytochrome bd-type quinol oxidase subunit 1